MEEEEDGEEYGGSRVRYFVGDKNFGFDTNMIRLEIIRILSLGFLTQHTG